jgi:hypothetical protein
VLVVAFLAFAQFGARGSAIGIAWPSIRASFDLPLSALGLFLAIEAAPYRPVRVDRGGARRAR